MAMTPPATSNAAPVIKDFERYKTTMCANWAARGACPYGPRCQFAHGEFELRKRPAKPTKPPNAWMRAKGKPTRSTDSLPTDDIASVQRAKLDALQALGLHPATCPPCQDFTVPAECGRATSPPVPAISPPLSSPSLFAYAPVDAASSASTTAAASPLCCNQTTGKVQACLSGTGCTEPALVRRGPSYSTQLVRRTVSFLFEGEPELARQKSSFGETLEQEDGQCGSSRFHQVLSIPKAAAASSMLLQSRIDSAAPRLAVRDWRV